jgi:hypothetical protein
MILNQLKYLLLFLLTFLLGVQTTYAKNEFILPKKIVSFSIESFQKTNSLKKDLQPNIGFLFRKCSEVKTKFELSESVSAWNLHKYSERDAHLLGNAGSLFTKLDNALFSVLKRKVNKLDDVLKPQFLDDFANASDDVLKKLQNDNLFDVWKNDIRSADVAELTLYKSKGSLRNDYITAVNSIADKAAELKALGKTDIEIAQEVFDLRRQTTIDFKTATPDDILDIIFEFNYIRYTQKDLGDKWGLLWNGALTKATKNGEVDYSAIITMASKPAGTKEVLGKLFYEIVGAKTLPVLEKYRMTSLIIK